MKRNNEQACSSLATSTSLSGAIKGLHTANINNYSHPTSGIYEKGSNASREVGK